MIKVVTVVFLVFLSCWTKFCNAQSSVSYYPHIDKQAKIGFFTTDRIEELGMNIEVKVSNADSAYFNYKCKVDGQYADYEYVGGGVPVNGRISDSVAAVCNGDMMIILTALNYERDRILTQAINWVIPFGKLRDKFLKGEKIPLDAL